MASNKKKKREHGSVKIQGIFFPTLIGIAATVVIALLLILAFGRLAYGTEDPSEYSCTIGLAALYVSAFVGGLLASAFGGKSISLSALHAALITLILIIADIIYGGLSTNGMIMKLLTPASSLLGGMVCSFRPKRKKKPKFKGRSK